MEVKHRKGPITEETHYYPFGLTMAAISTRSGSRIESKSKFQGQEFAHNEFSDGSGLEMYEFKYRMADPQTGRFWQVDPLAEKYVYNSTYAFSENKVVAHVELEGLESIEFNNAVRAAILYMQQGASPALVLPLMNRRGLVSRPADPTEQSLFSPQARKPVPLLPMPQQAKVLQQAY